MSAAEMNDWPSFSDVLDAPDGAPDAEEAAAPKPDVSWPALSSETPRVDAPVATEAPAQRTVAAPAASTSAPENSFASASSLRSKYSTSTDSSTKTGEIHLPPPLQPLDLNVASLDQLLPERSHDDLNSPSVAALEPLEDSSLGKIETFADESSAMTGTPNVEFGATTTAEPAPVTAAETDLDYAWPELTIAEHQADTHVDNTDLADLGVSPDLDSPAIFDEPAPESDVVEPLNAVETNTLDDDDLFGAVADHLAVSNEADAIDWSSWDDDANASDDSSPAFAATDTADEIEQHLGELIGNEDDSQFDMSLDGSFEPDVADFVEPVDLAAVVDEDASATMLFDQDISAYSDSSIEEAELVSGVDEDAHVHQLPVEDFASLVPDDDSSEIDADVIALYPEANDSEDIVGLDGSLDDALESPSMRWVGVEATETQEDPWAYMRPDPAEDVKPKRGFFSKFLGSSKPKREASATPDALPAGAERPICPNCASEGQVEIPDHINRRLHSSCSSCGHVWTDSYDEAAAK